MSCERSRTVHGKVLWWCSHFRAFILPERCEGERRFARLTPADAKSFVRRMRTSKGRRGGGDSGSGNATAALDLLCAAADRQECLRCPGVVKRCATEAGGAPLTDGRPT